MTTIDLAQIEAHCRSKPGIAASRPFGRQPLVFKVAGRMFALLGQLHGQDVVSLKCDPDRGAMLRGSFPSITPGYHLNKEHWNTLALDGSLPPSLITELVEHAYELVAASGKKPATARKKPAVSPKQPAAARKAPVAARKSPAAARTKPVAPQPRPAASRKQPATGRSR